MKKPSAVTSRKEKEKDIPKRKSTRKEIEEDEEEEEISSLDSEDKSTSNSPFTEEDIVSTSPKKSNRSRFNFWKYHHNKGDLDNYILSNDNVVSGSSRVAMVKLIRDEHKRYKEDVKDFSVFFPKDTESLEVLFTFFDLDENDTYENWLNAIEDNEPPAAIRKESELYRFVLTETFGKPPRIGITYNALSRILKAVHFYCMKESTFNDSVDREFNYSLSYKSARARFKKSPAELISDGYAIQVFKQIVDTLPKEVKDLHTRFGSQARYGFC